MNNDATCRAIFTFGLKQLLATLLQMHMRLLGDDYLGLTECWIKVRISKACIDYAHLGVVVTAIQIPRLPEVVGQKTNEVCKQQLLEETTNLISKLDSAIRLFEGEVFYITGLNSNKLFKQLELAIERMRVDLGSLITSNEAMPGVHKQNYLAEQLVNEFFSKEFEENCGSIQLTTLLKTMTLTLLSK